MTEDQIYATKRARETMRMIEQTELKIIKLRNELYDFIQYSYKKEDNTYDLVAVKKRAQELKQLENKPYNRNEDIKIQFRERSDAIDELAVLRRVFGAAVIGD